MATEVLVSSQQTNTPNISCCFWDYHNGNILQLYKNGGGVSEKSLNILGSDYILTAEPAKPLLHLWTLNSQEVVKNIRLVLPEPATCIESCPFSKFVAVGINTKLYVWELCTGKLITVQSLHYQAIKCIKFSSRSEYLLVAGKDGMIVCYQFMDLISTGNNLKVQTELGQVEPVYKKMDHSLQVSDLYVGKFGLKSRFVSVSLDQTLRIYQLSDGLLLLTLVFDAPLTSVTLDMSNVYVGDTNGKITRVSLMDPPRSLEHHVNDTQRDEFLGHTGKITSMDLNIYNDRLASASEDCQIFVWCLKSQQVLKKIDVKSIPTNVKFLLISKQFFTQDARHRVIISSFERSVEQNPHQNVVSWIQPNSFDVMQDYKAHMEQLERNSIESLHCKVVQLKTINKELLKRI